MWNKILNSGTFWGVVLGLLFSFLIAHWCNAQTVVRKGNTFYQQSNSNKIEKDSAVFSGYHYFDAKGIRYPIYISSKGKCFIWRTSSKTGKQYKQYLLEVTKQLSNMDEMHRTIHIVLSILSIITCVMGLSYGIRHEDTSLILFSLSYLGYIMFSVICINRDK